MNIGLPVRGSSGSAKFHPIETANLTEFELAQSHTHPFIDGWETWNDWAYGIVFCSTKVNLDVCVVSPLRDQKPHVWPVVVYLGSNVHHFTDRWKFGTRQWAFGVLFVPNFTLIFVSCAAVGRETANFKCWQFGLHTHPPIDQGRICHARVSYKVYSSVLNFTLIAALCRLWGAKIPNLTVFSNSTFCDGAT